MTEANNMDCLQQLASEATTWEEFIKEQDIDINFGGGHAPKASLSLRDQQSRAKDLKREPDEDEDSSQKLPRSDVALYGIYPKIDGRVLSICVGCKGVFHPQHIKEHTCTNRNKTTIPQSLKKKVKNKKKSQASPLPPPPIFQEEPVSPSTSTTTSEVPLITELDKIPSTIDPFETEPVVSTTVPAQIIATTVEIGPSSPIIVTTTSSTTATVTTTCNDETIPTTTSSETVASSNETTINTGNTTYTSNGSPNSSSSSSSSKYKKTKRAKIPKEYNADVHCGVIDSKGICMRSITCSNHRIQQRKLVAGRTKDIHQLIADKKAAKEKDENSVEDEKEPDRQDNSFVPLLTTATSDKEVAKTSNTHIPTLPKTTENDPVQKTTSSSSATTAVLHMEVPTDANLSELAKSDDGYHSSNNSSTQEAASSPHVPVVYMPMSPVSVVSPVQLVQIGNNMVCIESPQPALSPPLPSQSFLWKIPDPIPSVKVYKTHPKPAALPTFGAKKIGGAVLLSNHRLECQYNDIQVAVATRRKASNNAINYKAVSLLNNTPHRPNILKVKNKNCKRPSTDKLITSESKQIRLAPDVNGFILHSDMSEGAEAPQANNSIQEKIALLNMK